MDVANYVAYYNTATITATKSIIIKTPCHPAFPCTQSEHSKSHNLSSDVSTFLDQYALIPRESDPDPLTWIRFIHQLCQVRKLFQITEPPIWWIHFYGSILKLIPLMAPPTLPKKVRSRSTNMDQNLSPGLPALPCTHSEHSLSRNLSCGESHCLDPYL